MMEPYRARIVDETYKREYRGLVIHEFKALGKFTFRRDDYYEDRNFDTQFWKIVPE